MTQRELAMTAEVDIKTIYNLESGERWPQAGTRAKIEKALGWTMGSLEAFTEGPERETGYQFPTRAELIDDALRRRNITPEQVRSFAGIGEYAWARLTDGSATIAEARREEASLAAELARVAIYLGITAEQLANAGQTQAARIFRDATVSATLTEPTSAVADDPQLRQIIDAWPRLQQWQKNSVVGVLEQLLSQSPETAGKPAQTEERRTG